jgi:putative redox protein
MTAAYTFPSGRDRLTGHLARPSSPASSPPPGLVLCHGAPAGATSAGADGQTYAELADRIASEAGWLVLTFTFRHRSPAECLDDLGAGVDHLVASEQVSGVWLAGSSAGGALAICLAAEDHRVRGVASLAAPAEFDDTAEISPVRAIGKIPPRALLVLHGSDDEVVPASEARELADAAGGTTELVVLSHAGHRLRHDPRAVAVLMGWLDRQARG